MAFPTNNCDPRLIVVDDASGATLTRASIRAFTKQDFEDQAMKEVGMDRIIAQTKEARMAGVKERALTDLLLSRHVALSSGKGSDTQSVISPFTLVPRRNVVNANYFQITAGEAGAGAGTGVIPTGLWQVTVGRGSSPWAASPNNPLVNLEKYFLAGSNVVVEHMNTTTGVAYTAHFKIYSAAYVSAGVATVLLEPNKSQAIDTYQTVARSIAAPWWTSATSAQKAVYQPANGVIRLIGNSVSDYDSYGLQYPAVNNVTLIEYWKQTLRWAFSYNEEYLKALESPLTSEFFKKFRTLPLAQQRKQIEMLLEGQFYNVVFYGDELNDRQTVEGYTSLPLVYDPTEATYPIEYKANTLGIRTQIDRCGRRYDKQNQPLNLDDIFEMCYNLKRNREATSGNIDTIDAMTDRATKGRIRDLMFKYYKQKYGTDISFNFQGGQKISFNGATVFEYDKFDIPDQGVSLALFTDPYFDDQLAVHATATKSRGRALWMVDWSDVAINILRTASAKRTTNVADALYRYVITPNVKQTMLNSKTFEVRVGDTNRHALYENFSDGCPTLTVAGCDLSA